MEITSLSNVIGEEIESSNNAAMMKQSNLFSESSENLVNSEPILKVNSKDTLRDAFNVESLGQVFTPKSIAKFMSELRTTSGVALEPSCGNGVFFQYLPKFKALEIDPSHAPSDAIILDFFKLSTSEKFECVIGNPPYVRYQDISEETKMLLDESFFDKRSNLYLFFIEKKYSTFNRSRRINLYCAEGIH